MRVLVLSVAVCCLTLLSATALAEESASLSDLEVALQQPESTLPPVVVEPTPQPEYQYYGPGSGSPNGPYAWGTIPWNSNEITSDRDLVGPYGQPPWTTQRPFSTARSYVLPAGMMQFEQWVRPTYNKGSKPEYRFLEEYAIGLPGRFQLDIYERWNVEPNGSNNETANHEGVQIELRYALADWGVIPLNPTLYAEWVERGGPQDKSNKYEIKLLLSDEILPNLYFASNLIMEQEVNGELENELGWSNAFSTTLIERKLLAGVEFLWQGQNVHGSRNDRTSQFEIGPSMQWRPTNRTYLNVVGLFGTNDESPQCQMYIIFGYQWGGRAGPAGGYISGPSSTIGN